MVTKFQRTSSAVEGRNGYLTQMHHNRRGLSPSRLKVRRRSTTFTSNAPIALLPLKDYLANPHLTCLNPY
jgi:hypothetical protein